MTVVDVSGFGRASSPVDRDWLHEAARKAERVHYVEIEAEALKVRRERLHAEPTEIFASLSDEAKAIWTEAGG